MDDQIKEMTLLLLYLNSWEEDRKKVYGPVCRSWKTYRFDLLDRLADEGMLRNSPPSKSVTLTAEGRKQGEILKKKYGIKD